MATTLRPARASSDVHRSDAQRGCMYAIDSPAAAARSESGIQDSKGPQGHMGVLGKRSGGGRTGQEERRRERERARAGEMGRGRGRETRPGWMI